MPTFSLKLLLVPMLVSGIAMAQPAEVSDGPSINLRQAGSAAYPVVASLAAHTQVEVIETGRAYAHVTTTEGHDGWMLKSRLAFPQEGSPPPAQTVGVPSSEDDPLNLKKALQDERNALAARDTQALWLALICTGVAFMLGIAAGIAYFNYHYGWLIASKQYTLHGRWKWIFSWRR